MNEVIKFIKKQSDPYYGNLAFKKDESGDYGQAFRGVFTDLILVRTDLYLHFGKRFDAIYSFKRTLSSKQLNSIKYFIPELESSEAEIIFSYSHRVGSLNLHKTREYTKIFLNDNTIDVYYKYVNLENLKKYKKFKERIQYLYKTLGQLQGDVIISSGGVLAAFGLRDTTDIDLITTGRVSTANNPIKGSFIIKSSIFESKYIEPREINPMRHDKYLRSYQEAIPGFSEAERLEDRFHDPRVFFFLYGMKFHSIYVELLYKSARMTPKGYADTIVMADLLGKKVKLRDIPEGKIEVTVGKVHVSWPSGKKFKEAINKKLVDLFHRKDLQLSF